jgi:hypothetical protein
MINLLDTLDELPQACVTSKVKQPQAFAVDEPQRERLVCGREEQRRPDQPPKRFGIIGHRPTGERERHPQQRQRQIVCGST